MFDPPDSVDLSRPNAARIYDYALGGDHNFAVDREFADRMWSEPGYSTAGYKLNRSFLRRAVRFMVSQGIEQFLDLGSGIPTVGNVHEIAQAAGPQVHVVYVDNEPVAVAHARQLLADNDNAIMIDADLRDPDAVLHHPDTRRMLDFDRPLGVLFVACLHFVPDDAATIVARYRNAMNAGGYLALSHFTLDGHTTGDAAKAVQWYQQTTTPVVPRTAAELHAILAGAELVHPGLVWTPLWRPDGADPALENVADSGAYAAVGHVSGHR
jgi:SAM-dependent methyltransferase